MKNSKIAWTDHTFNPWIGCTKVSPGCLNCYAAAQDHRWGHDSFGKGKPRRRTSDAYWKQPLKWNRDAADFAANCSAAFEAPPAHPKVFCASLADWLDDEMPIEWLADLLALIQATPNLDWLLLTKRPENWARRVEAASLCEHNDRNEYYGRNAGGWMASWLRGEAPANVWIGTTVENQYAADERIPALLQIPAKVRFLSCEPLIGSVDLRLVRTTPCAHRGCLNHVSHPCEGCGYQAGKLPIHWVICGGESGPGARPMNPNWARSLRDQCKASAVPFFFKQWGAWMPWQMRPEAPRFMGDDGELAECGGMVRNQDQHAAALLDGDEHKEFPNE